MKNPEREKSLKRISELHQALRFAGCGANLPGFGHLKLAAIANELRARIEVENMCVQMDEPGSHFMELVEDVVKTANDTGTHAALRKLDEIAKQKPEDLN